MTNLTVPYLDLRRQHALAADDVAEAVLRVTRSGWYVLGPEVEAFEAEFAAWCGARHCVGVGNGLDAITLSLQASGVGPGDEVLVPSNTYIATWLAVTAVGARPVPVEPRIEDHLIDPAAVVSAISPRTRAILPVHLYGRAVDVTALREVIAGRAIAIIADAAQAHGARLGSGQVGALADAEAFSFYPTKNLGALGDGGAITTDDDVLADRVRVLRNYGSRRKYDNEVRGVNSRLDEIQAAVLRAQLPYVTRWNDRRREIADRFSRAMADLDGLVLPETPADRAEHVWHVYCVRHPRRDALQAALTERGVGTQIFYPTPPHRSAAYADHQIPDHACERATVLADTGLALPIAPYLTDVEVEFVIDRVVESVRQVVAEPALLGTGTT